MATTTRAETNETLRSASVDDVQADRFNGTLERKTVSTVSGETCTWKANGECMAARSCYECLNVVLQSGESCAINAYGSCVNINEYDSTLDFRRKLPLNVLHTSMNYFPSPNTTYCEDDDKYCDVCRTAWYDPFASRDFRQLLFCRGENGCVCTRSCDAPYFQGRVIMDRCVARASAERIYGSVAAMVGLCFLFAIIAGLMRMWMRRLDRQRGSSLRTPPNPHHLRLRPREPTGPRLNLSGWRSMREKLIETERAELEDVGVSASAGVTESSSAASQRVVLDSTPGPAVEVEMGDGYRPMSPSDRVDRYLPSVAQQQPVPSETARRDEDRASGAVV